MPGPWGYLLLAMVGAGQLAVLNGGGWLTLVVIPFPLAALAVGLWHWPGPLTFVGLVVLKGLGIYLIATAIMGERDVVLSPFLILFGLIEMGIFVAGLLAILLIRHLRR